MIRSVSMIAFAWLSKALVAICINVFLVFLPSDCLNAQDMTSSSPGTQPNILQGFKLAGGWPARVFAPYMYIGADDNFQITQCADACGQKFYTIAFIIADENNNPAWDGRIPMGKNLYASQINAIRARGGDVIVSFGGAGGTELAIVETNTTKLEAKYQSVIDQYKLTWLDFDIEGGALSKEAVNQRRNTALAELQSRNPGLIISYTLPVDPNGISKESRQLLNDAKAKGVKVHSANLMTMDFGAHFSQGKKMSDVSIASALKAHEQCQKIDPAMQIGLTAMIGQNDQRGETFTPEDARVLKNWAESEPWICSLSFWAINRDAGKFGKNGSDNETSGIKQKPWEFTLIFKPFTSSASRPQLNNNRAQISPQSNGIKSVASVRSEGLPTQFFHLTNSPGHAAKLTLNVAAIDRERILKAANIALKLEPPTITRYRAKLSHGGPNDFYSNADYFWPNPATPDGLPYVNRDGESNPNNFSAHRMAMRRLRNAVAALAAAYKISGDDRYVAKAAGLLQVFFLNPQTRMNPNLQFAQAVPGSAPGRSWGIIDGLHLAEIPVAIEVMKSSPALPQQTLAGLKDWFQQLTDWMMTSKNGRAEAAANNNHAVAFFLQIAAFAKFTGDDNRLAECRRQFKQVFVPMQMAADGSFPLELKRTKPYGYSIFQLDNLAILCQLLSTSEDNLWNFKLADGRGMKEAMHFLYPYLADKSRWPYAPDVQAWNDWPVREPALLLCGLAYQEPKYLELWERLPASSTNDEVLRNEAITQPILWF